MQPNRGPGTSLYLGLGKSGKTRTRLPHSKSRNGCFTCKQRHTRCDEQKPFCATCRKANRECGGYAAEPASTKPAYLARTIDALAFRNTFGPPCRRDPSASSVTETSPTLRIIQYDPHRESESLTWDYYYLETAPALELYASGCFWSDIVPRIALASPAVRDAALAIASLHRNFQQAPALVPAADEARQEGDESLEYYGSSLRELQRCMSKTPDSSTLTAALMTSLLLAVYESLRGRRAKVALHVKYGLQIAREGSDTARVWSDRSWVELYIGKLGFSLSMYDSTTISDVDAQVIVDAGTGSLLDVVCNARHMSRFDALHAAIHNLTNDVYRFVFRIRSGEYQDEAVRRAELARLKAQYLQWTEAARSYGSDHASSVALKAAHARSLFAYISLQTAESTREEDFDQYTGVFAEILLLMASAVKGHLERSPSVHDRPPPFSVDFAAMPLLFRVALHCRHPQLRRGAIELLEYCPQREGIWTTQITMAATSAIVDFEESFMQGIDADGMAIIPEAHRVFHIRRARKEPSVSTDSFAYMDLITRPDPDKRIFASSPLRINLNKLRPRPCKMSDEAK